MRGCAPFTGRWGNSELEEETPGGRRWEDVLPLQCDDQVTTSYFSTLGASLFSSPPRPPTLDSALPS